MKTPNKKVIALASVTLLLFQLQTHAQCVYGKDSCNGSDAFCGPYALSRGIYRLPFADGTVINVINDHMNHCPRGRFDLGAPVNSTIVAAADGWIRFLQDNYTCTSEVGCSCGQVTACPNNYVWIEHPNGEWTKYTHMQNGSVTALGHYVNEFVTAGTALGTMGQVGCATGPHLHFEVATLIDTNTLVICSSAGGWFDGDFADNIIPVFCDISGNILVESGSYIANPCDGNCANSVTHLSGSVSFPDQTIDITNDFVTCDDYTIYAKGAALFQAGDYVSFTPGFRAISGSQMLAQIAPCDEMAEKPEPGNEIIRNENDNWRVSVYPNPVINKATITLELKNDGMVSIQLMDLLGRNVESIANQQLQSGTYDFTADMNELTQELYLLQVRVNENVEAIKIVKQ